MATDLDKLLKDYLTAWDAHDVEKMLTFCTDDCVYECMALGMVNRGKKELKEFFSSMFVDLPDVKLEMKSGFTAGDRGAGEWVMSGTFAHSSIPGVPATGKSFTVRGASVTEFKNDKISRNTAYWNFASFLQQVGIMPGPPK